MINNKEKILSPVNIFIFISIVNIIIMFFLLYITRGKILTVYSYGYDRGDFWCLKSALESMKDGYEYCYPPLAYIFANMFFIIFSEEQLGNTFLYTETVNTLYFSIFICLFIIIINNIINEKSIKKNIISFILLFSYPVFWNGFGRGNEVIYAGMFLISGYFLSESDNKLKKEVGLWFIAISAAFKLYPALIGLIFLSQKKWKESIRLIGYGIIAFLLPFCFGAFNLFEYLKSFFIYINKNIYSQTSIVGNAIAIFGNDKGLILGRILICLWLAWVLFYLFSEKKSWKSLTMLISLMTIVMAESYIYNYIYLIIPLVEFLNNEKFNWFNVLFAILFSFVFTCIPIMWVDAGVAAGMYLSYIIILMIISIEKVLKIVIRKDKNKII